MHRTSANSATLTQAGLERGQLQQPHDEQQQHQELEQPVLGLRAARGGGSYNLN